MNLWQTCNWSDHLQFLSIAELLYNSYTDHNSKGQIVKKDIRWKQRFQNFEKAYLFLKKGTELLSLDDLQAAGLIQSFEFTFELSWKTLKDYLEEMGISLKFPREVLKRAFQSELIEDGALWLEMLEKRNELTHTYDEVQTRKAVQKIRERYFPALHQVYEKLRNVS